MITIDVRTDLAQGLRQLYALEPRQFPFIAALAMNRTMRRIKDDQRREMERSFDRPTRFTLNSLQTMAASKDRLETWVKLRDFAGKGTPASKYLLPEVEGGPRRYKGHEKALAAAGLLPAGMFAVPAKGAPLDGYGNLRGSYIVQILSDLKAFGETGYTANRNSKRKAKGRFYVVNGKNARDHRGLPWGIYERGGRYGKTAAASALGINSRMVIAFVKAPSYRKRFRFYEIAEANARLYLGDELRKAADEAMRSSRDGKLSSLDITRALRGL